MPSKPKPRNWTPTEQKTINKVLKDSFASYSPEQTTSILSNLTTVPLSLKGKGSALRLTHEWLEWQLLFSLSYRQFLYNSNNIIANNQNYLEEYWQEIRLAFIKFIAAKTIKHHTKVKSLIVYLGSCWRRESSRVIPAVEAYYLCDLRLNYAQTSDWVAMKKLYNHNESHLLESPEALVRSGKASTMFHAERMSRYYKQFEDVYRGNVKLSIEASLYGGCSGYNNMISYDKIMFDIDTAVRTALGEHEELYRETDDNSSRPECDSAPGKGSIQPFNKDDYVEVIWSAPSYPAVDAMA